MFNLSDPFYLEVYTYSSDYTEPFICSGTILTPYLILTTAQCLYFRFRYTGQMRITAFGENYENQDFHLHENFTLGPFGSKNDIGIVRLKTPIKIPENVTLTKLPRQSENLPGANSHVSIYPEPGKDYLEDVKPVKVKVISLEDCRLNHTDLEITESFMCTEGKYTRHRNIPGTVAICKENDNSDPVACGMLITGGFDTSAIFLKLSLYADWIESAMERISNKQKCQSHEIYCSGTCINRLKICDGTMDCANGEDESIGCDNALHCWSHQFRCENGKCVEKNTVCDGLNDCGDGSDEFKCKKISIATGGYHSCTQDEFRCSYPMSRCIPNDWACDGVFDCDDLSDENESCTNYHNNYQAHLGTSTTTTTSTTTARPFRYDCKSNETYCWLKNVSEGIYGRTEGFCLPWVSRLRCDGVGDCIGDHDERDCAPVSERCPSDMFFCPKSDRVLMPYNCAPLSWKCDGIPDCPNQEDERDCITTTTTTSSTTTTSTTTPAPFTGCNNKTEFECWEKCIPIHKRCDGKLDCRISFLDEEGCPPRPKKIKANLIPIIITTTTTTTTTTTPEPNTSCQPNQFGCLDYSDCIQNTFVCDGERDCLDGSDELNCKTAKDSGLVTFSDKPCSTDKLECPMLSSMRACVPFDWKCDGEEDCPWGYDEKECAV